MGKGDSELKEKCRNTGPIDRVVRRCNPRVSGPRRGMFPTTRAAPVHLP